MYNGIGPLDVPDRLPRFTEFREALIERLNVSATSDVVREWASAEPVASCLDNLKKVLTDKGCCSADYENWKLLDLILREPMLPNRGFFTSHLSELVQELMKSGDSLPKLAAAAARLAAFTGALVALHGAVQKIDPPSLPKRPL